MNMRLLFFSALAFLLVITVFTTCKKDLIEADLVVLNGTVYAGDRTAPFKGHIGIKDDKIVYVGTDQQAVHGKEVIDVTGYVISPGFIDPHTHANGDLNDSLRNSNENYLLQGVTTVFVGNDGRSNTDLIGQFALWENQGIGTNAATYVGHSTVRRQVMGMRDAVASTEELQNMAQLVHRDMDAGAIGLSSGLYYPPASYSNTEEVIALATVVAEYGGVYDVHLRDESSYTIGLIKAIEETIRISEEAGVPGHIAHIKCLGTDVWGKSGEVIHLIENARNRGLKITADQYPYLASGTSIGGALIPRWVFADGDAADKLRDPELSTRIRTEVRENLRRRGGPSSLLFTDPGENIQDIKGLTLQDVAEKRQIDAVDAAIDIFLSGGSSVASFNMDEADLQHFMKQDWVMTGSDGSHGHPRKYGTYPKKIKEYVIDKKIISLDDMIYRSAALPAKTFNIYKRGVLSAGNYADIIVFKPEEVEDTANFEDAFQMAKGMHLVMVNGLKVVENGRFLGVLNGRALRLSNNLVL